MKIYLSTLPVKDQLETFNEMGVENRLYSYYFLEQSESGSRAKRINKRMAQIWKMDDEEQEEK